MAENPASTSHNRGGIRLGNTVPERSEENQEGRDSEENELRQQERLISIYTKVKRIEDGITGEAHVTQEEMIALCRQSCEETELAIRASQSSGTRQRADLESMTRHLALLMERCEAMRNNI